MEIRVRNSVMHKPKSRYGWIGTFEIPVVEGILKLIELPLTSNNGVNVTGTYAVFVDGKYYQPIIISETEPIEIGDVVLNGNKFAKVISEHEYLNAPFDQLTSLHKKNDWCTLEAAIQYKHPKILALPTHFSINTRDQIVMKEIKNSDKLLVSCETKYVEPSNTIHSNRGHDITVIKHFLGEVILYLPETKVYTRKDVLKFLEQFENVQTESTNIVEYVKANACLPVSAKEWFEKNVK